MSPDDRVQAFQARDLLYQRRGLDRALAARFVVASGGALRGPALDIGTGKGLLAIELARVGLDVVSIDLDAREQELAAMLSARAGVAERIHFVHGDAAQLAYPDRHFACVAMMNVLHHLEEPAPVLRELVRVLDVDGIAIVAEFDHAGFDLVDSVHEEGGGQHHRSGTTLAAAHEELARAGLRTVRQTAGHFNEVVVMRKAGVA